MSYTQQSLHPDDAEKIWGIVKKDKALVRQINQVTSRLLARELGDDERISPWEVEDRIIEAIRYQEYIEESFWGRLVELYNEHTPYWWVEH